MLKMTNKKLILILALGAVASIVLYMLYDLNPAIFFYQIPSRAKRVAAIVIVGVAIAVSTVIFQTIVKNRILTPSIMGLDSVYVFIQTSMIFFGGASSAILLNSKANYFVSMVLLVIFTLFVFKFLFKFTKNNVFLLLLIGIILGTLFGNLATFMQMMISPEDFLILQNNLFGSFSAVDESLLWITGIIVLVSILFVLKDFNSLDVMSLGRDHAMNLGVNYDRKVSQLLVIIAVLVSAATALVGPMMFLGLLVVNIAHEVFSTYRHVYLIIGSAMISIITLVFGQMIIQFMFDGGVELSIIINLVGGLYFIYLMLRRSKI
ncbi:iron chelate uptake ABC transporter family permease subunit [Salinicoccus halodurans]|uniref:Iron complex transport system permease protein n=2 Tax=Salinicoccus halodurans TaxID=407035 RepID=A0AA94KWP8_9STAP|nr:iron chelate uptake ABC transporter family permease subunit [Salinicoccus halodurans]SFK84082.1 iron complex transport system permease protein [Salinicoccus halodurans]